MFPVASCALYHNYPIGLGLAYQQKKASREEEAAHHPQGATQPNPSTI